MKTHAKGLIIIFLLLSFAITGCSSNGLNTSTKKTVIGAVVYSFDDTWITYVRNEVYKASADKAQVDIWSGNNAQTDQDAKIDLFIKRKVNSLVVQTVDLQAAGSIIDKAQKANIPIVFFNHEPPIEVLQKWNQVYYVGAKSEQSGTMQGEILVNYFKSHPTKDGIIRYVMLKGELGQKDTEMRTQYSIKALEDAGFIVQKVAEDTANWNREKGQELMSSFLATNAGNFDCVLANNDDMALGAIDALKSAGYFKNDKYMPVVGVDATEAALKAVLDGTLLGTVMNDAIHQGDAIFNLANILATGQTPTNENVGYPITDGKYVWIDYKTITKENIGDAK